MSDRENHSAIPEFGITLEWGMDQKPTPQNGN
jgi:hypothetical protein